MVIKGRIGVAILVALLIVPSIESRAADTWQEDFRRCLVRKQFPAGVIVLSAGERDVELDIQWTDGKDLNDIGETELSVQIDGTALPRPRVLKSDAGLIYGYSLGSMRAVLPALSRGRRLRVSLADDPERSVNLDIGGGKKAVAFLKKCDAYWTNWRRTH